MLDTVRLTVPMGKFTITRHELFTPSTESIFGYTTFGGRVRLKCVQHPSKNDLKEGLYKPKLTVTKRMVKGGPQINLTIEFSAPKLLFGNNFDELEEKDFEEVIRRLESRLLRMGVEVKREDLMGATVSAIHFSKNIAFTDYSTVSSVLRYLERIDLNGRLDLNKTDFRNKGAAVYYYSKAHSLVFYDKVQDLRQPKGRGMEKKDYNLQVDIFDEIRRKTAQPVEVLRMEYRICNRQKMRSLLKQVGEPEATTFREFFSKRIAEKMLQYYWNIILEGVHPIVFSERKPDELLRIILQQGLARTATEALQIIGALSFVKYDGERYLRGSLKANFSNRVCQYVLKKVKKVDLGFAQQYAPFELVSRALIEFKPLKMSDLITPFV